MTWQQAFNIFLTVLFVAVLIELLFALTLFHWRMFQEDRRRRKANRQTKKGASSE
jgi:uncharacterized protein HemY